LDTIAKRNGRTDEKKSPTSKERAGSARARFREA